MDAELTRGDETLGWIFYDADCSLCARSAARANRLLARRGFHLLPLQTPGTAERLSVTPDTLFARMHLLTGDGRRFAGADAFIEVARHVWWARPIVTASRLPLVLCLLQRCYAWVARNRHCFNGTCRLPRRDSVMDLLPLFILPTAVFVFRDHLDPWAFMWAMAFALYAGCKWLTYRKAVALGTDFTTLHALGYLFGWVGMEPAAFSALSTSVPTPRKTEWLAAFGRVILGATLVWAGVRLLLPVEPLAAGWLGMFGVILLLHFGLFHLLGLAWQRAGVPVQLLMRAPLLSTSLGDLWGARWNTGFHSLAHEFVFRSLRRLMGGTMAMLAVFLVSGLVHELVITLPARGGYGLPTTYFLLQGLGLALERSAPGRRIGFSAGILGRIFAIGVAAVPAFWLFPPVFVLNVILPMLHAIGAT